MNKKLLLTLLLASCNNNTFSYKNKADNIEDLGARIGEVQIETLASKVFSEENFEVDNLNDLLKALLLGAIPNNIRVPDDLSDTLRELSEKIDEMNPSTIGEEDIRGERSQKIFQIISEEFEQENAMVNINSQDINQEHVAAINLIIREINQRAATMINRNAEITLAQSSLVIHAKQIIRVDGDIINVEEILDHANFYDVVPTLGFIGPIYLHIISPNAQDNLIALIEPNQVNLDEDTIDIPNAHMGEIERKTIREYLNFAIDTLPPVSASARALLDHLSNEAENNNNEMVLD